MKLFSRQMFFSASFALAFFLLEIILISSHAHSESGNLNNNSSPSLVAGFRAAYNLSSYPDHQFPSAESWTRASQTMAAKFSGADAAAIWIVSLYLEDGFTQPGFPSAGKRYSKIAFAPNDYSEAHLSHFDSTGMKVWLQIEPGAANVETLIDLVLERYGHHPCVAGLGIDVEWYHAHLFTHGRKVTDAEASRWEQRVQSHNPAYRLFLKHYAQAWMPPHYRGKILFIDDSQQFYSLAAMISEFKIWGERFYPNQVAFQFGYPADKAWWGELADPPATVGKALLAEIPNAYGLFWVDFTISQIFHSTPIVEKKMATEKVQEESISRDLQPSFTLVQNFLHSLNQSIDIVLDIPEPSHVRVEVYDASGRMIDLAVDTAFQAGDYRVQWNPPQRSKMKSTSGLYYYSMKTTRRTITKSLLLNEPRGEKPDSEGVDQNSSGGKR